ncbi:MAG: HD domain-containing protein [Myxococcales bacterium]|nr:HD domain-containing protein [Myxococcales bacterium]
MPDLPYADRVFRDPVHGLIEFVGENRPLAAILDTRAFQRLRRVKQMGFAWQVYSGAEHSRFGHALGAFHVASLVVDRLRLDEPVRLHVKAAALLHDVGHGPFSHTWEQVFPTFDHEEWGARIVTEDEEMASVLRSLDPQLPEALGSFTDKTYRPTFARKLVSSQLDVDRLDYLLRDGHYSGAGYATYDLEWILHALRIEDVHRGDDPEDLVIDYRRGMYAVEQYLFARTYMYAQVYHHKAVRAAERMFIKLLSRFSWLAQTGDEPGGLAVAAKLARGERLDVGEFLFLDDYSLFTAVDSWAGLGAGGAADAASDPVVRDLAARLVRRRLFKTIDLGDDPSVIDEVKAEVHAIAEATFGESASSYYYLDNAQQIGYDAHSGEELYVVGHPRYGTVTLGRLLEDLPLGRPVSTVRLVCAPELVGSLQPIAGRLRDHSRDTPD